MILTLNLIISYNYFSAVNAPIFSSTAASKPINVQLPSVPQQGPVINNTNLKTELVYRGIGFPSSFAFLGRNDILLLQKDNGTVERIVNGTPQAKPLLHVNVATEAERGMLGIAIAKHANSPTYVFLYYTKSGGGKTGDDITEGKQPLGNRLYRYELVNGKLVNPKLLLDLPATPGPFHNGGKIVIGQDSNVYLVIGDLFGNKTKAQNFVNGADPDGTGGVLRITQDGKPVGKGILGDKYPLNLYYGYGIRNSFGINFDPVTGKLWDTENGPGFGDEINLVEPGFNSGWMQVQGIWKTIGGFPGLEEGPIVTNPERGLVDFGGKGKYRPPEFTWSYPVAPTSLTFPISSKLGKKYENDMLVSDFNNGNIYDFRLNKERNGLILNGSLADKIAYNSKLDEPINWSDTRRNCDFTFRCIIDRSTAGWQNIKTSLQLSTNATNKNTWPWIYGKEIDVIPGEQYVFTTHMKLNNFATGSHIKLEGYDPTSKTWNQITQCPSGTNGPLEWHEYSCKLTIPANTTKIRPVLNAGWSSQPGKEAVTLFDSIYLSKVSLNKIIYNFNLTHSNLISNPRFVYSDGGNYARFISLCKLRGDFDVQMRYRLLNWPQFNGVGFGLIAQESAAGNSNATYDNLEMSVERISLDPKINFSHPSEVYATHFNDGVHMINATHMTNYTDDKPVTADKGDVSGKLRIVRSGFTIKGYYYRSGTWIPLHSSTNVSSSDVNIILQGGTRYLGHKPAEIAFLSYLVRKGNIVDCQTK